MEMTRARLNPPIPPEVIAEELDQLAARRNCVFPESAGSGPANHPASAPPHDHAPDDARSKVLSVLFRRSHGFKPFGVALSGGGIRSATFNLGILQGLAERGLLKYVDYLSTVSGGGYIGSWLHGIIRNRFDGDPARASRFLSPTTNPIPGSPEEDPVSFLRKYSNYLVPQPALFSADSWVIGVIWLRNVLLNQVILVPTVATGILALLIGGLVLQKLQPVTLGVKLVALVVALVALSAAVWIAYTNLRVLVCQTYPPGGKPLPAPGSPKPAERLSLFAAPLVFLSALLIGCLVLPGWTPYHIPVAAAAVVILIAMLLLKGGFLEGFAWRHGLDVGAARPLALLHAAWMVPVTAAVTIGPILAVATLLDPGADTGSALPWVTLALAPPAVCASVIVGIGLLIGLMGADYADGAREWISHVGAMIALLCAAWMAVLAIVVFAPVGVARVLESYTSLGVTAFGGWLATTAAGVIAGRSPRTGGMEAPKPARMMSLLTSVAPTVFMVGYVFLIAVAVHATFQIVSGTSGTSAAADPSPRPTRTYDVDITTPGGDSKVRVDVRPEPPPGWVARALRPVERFRARYWPSLSYERAALPGGPSPQSLEAATGLQKLMWLSAWLAACLAVAAIASSRFNINEFSMHHFYKNRLVRCYLGASNSARRKPNRLTGFDPSDDFPVATLLPTDPIRYCGPYAIVSAALNLNAGSELAQQERKAASFVFTPKFCGFAASGSEEDREQVRRSGGAFQKEGYRPTRGYSYPRGPELGTALAISGAAANPNGGYHTSGPMAFLLTVFDARLGWWLGNPRWEGPSKYPGPMLAWKYLIAELLGQTTGRSKFVNLSDGGHFDNLGLYELVRRRCRYIVVGDAEEDPGLLFESLGGAIRKCRADFGVEIDIDPQPIRVVEGRSATHCVMGTILYPENDLESGNRARGYLFYLKASLSGDEPSDVVEYQGRFPEFPHQKTLDQFFSESQFESYRRLGLHVARDAFEGIPKIPEAGGPGVLADTFKKLEEKWYAPMPVTPEAASRLADAYSALVRSLSETAGLDSLARQLFQEGLPEPPAGQVQPDRRVVAAVLEIIQLMQNVFTEFRLAYPANCANPRNRGWMGVFRRWARSEVVDQVWQGRRTDYNPLFQQFMEDLRTDGHGTDDRPLRP